MKVRLKAGCGSLTCPVAEGGDATLHPGDEAEVDRAVFYRYRHKLEELSDPAADVAEEQLASAVAETEGPIPHVTTQQRAGVKRSRRKR